MTPEKTLWQSVVFQAVIDATYEGVSAANLREKRSADSWLRGRGKDFCEVCHMAGMDPDFIHEAYVAGRVNREILKSASEFTARRVAE